VRTTATNIGKDPCPYGSGAHPYLTLGTPTVDGLILHVPTRTVLKSDRRGLPIGTQAVQDTQYASSGEKYKAYAADFSRYQGWVAWNRQKRMRMHVREEPPIRFS